MTRRTAGELSLKASVDKTIYDPLEVGYALTDDILDQLHICARRHEDIFSEDEFFIVLQVGRDPILAEARRHKYAAFLHLPKPRPSQSCFLYNRHTQSFKRLWCLPNPTVMAYLSEMTYVSPQWRLTKMWCDAFFKGWEYEKVEDKWVNKDEHHFFKVIRNHYNISHLSEKEFLEANRHKLIEAGAQDIGSLPPEPFDFSKVMTEKVVDTKESFPQKD